MRTITVNAQRQMEDSLLQASRAGRQFMQEIGTITPELEGVIQGWRPVDA